MSLPLVSDYEEYVAISDGESSYVPTSPYRVIMTSLPAGSTGADIRFSAASYAPSKTGPGSPSKHITVVDVYDLAASIGKDFERLVELYGNDCIRGIMPKVLSALETLEALANNNDCENEEILSLQKTVERLEAEKAAKQVDRVKFEDELEQIEENYRKEISELRAMVKDLMAENRSLATTVSSLPSPNEETFSSHAQEMESLLELKDMGQKQREEIKNLKNDVEMYMREVENMQNGIDRLIRQNEELLRKNSSLQKQGRMIIEEKSELMRRLEKTEVANIQLRNLVEEKDRVVKDLSEQSENEPRFTLAELREVLQEKNILKGRVMELEEEMTQFKRAHGFPIDDVVIDSLDLLEKEPEPTRRDDEKPVQVSALGDVQGPLPREPDEKVDPWKFQRRESGVRRFFPFFKELGGGGVTSSPRRGSSSITSSPRPVRSSTMSGLVIQE